MLLLSRAKPSTLAPFHNGSCRVQRPHHRLHPALAPQLASSARTAHASFDSNAQAPVTLPIFPLETKSFRGRASKVAAGDTIGP